MIRRKSSSQTSVISFTISLVLCLVCDSPKSSRGGRDGEKRWSGRGGLLFLKFSVCFMRDFYLHRQLVERQTPEATRTFSQPPPKPPPHRLSPSPQATTLNCFAIMALLNTLMVCLVCSSSVSFLLIISFTFLSVLTHLKES